MERHGTDVDGFIASLPEANRADIAALDEMVSDVMAGHPRELYEGKFWGGSDQEIIGYGRTQSQRSDKSGVEWFVIGLAMQKNYISLYVSAVEDGRYIAETYGPDLGKVKAGKSVISFTSLDDVDSTRLRTMLERARDASTGA
ncbi:MAG TPA: hypothetical protein VLA29_12235 [Acidimicrobiia bacterium]|nr:hypothetical protein [Acidimicrobiia bacterium]